MKSVLFRVDGGTQKNIGTGHIERCLRIADKLTGKYDICFAGLDREEYRYGHSRIKAAGYFLGILSSSNYYGDLLQLLIKTSPAFVVCDLYEYKEQELRILKKTNAPVMTFDHFGPFRSCSDYPINAIVSNPQHPFEGLDYMVLPPPGPAQFKSVPESIVVCFGGFDYAGLTLKILKMLTSMPINQQINVIVSSIYDQMDLLEDAAGAATNIRLLRQPENFGTLLATADIAITSGGLTFFQALSLGCSVIVLSQYPHQAQTVSDFSTCGAYLDLGLGKDVESSLVRDKLESLINDNRLRLSFYERARNLVDGKGLDRIVKLIEERLQ